MKEFKVGERITLEFVETDEVTCKGCFFSGPHMPMHCVELCTLCNNQINNHIILKEVKE